MALTLAELCLDTEKDYGMTLIAGEKGIDNMVQWVHYIEGGEAPRFLHGYELVFTTGMENRDTGWLLNFAERLHEYGACGFVINLGPYIKAVPSEVIEYCNSVNLPLYTIPWETRIVDITYEFCHHIITDEKQSRSMAETFIYAINNPLKEESYKPELGKYGFCDGDEYAVAAVKLNVNDKERRESMERMARYNLVRRLNRYTARHSIFTVDRIMFVICQGIEEADFEEQLKKQASALNAAFPEDRAFIGVSPYVKDSGLLFKSYRRSRDVVRLAESFEKQFLRYADTGMFKLLMAVDDKESIHDYYNDCLGNLIEYDNKNKTDYLDTLRCYLENDSSIAEVAKISFVHRNTVNYKIKKIKEILNCELTQKDKLMLTLAFMTERII